MVNRCDWEQDNLLQLELYTQLARTCQQQCPQLVSPVYNTSLYNLFIRLVCVVNKL